MNAFDELQGLNLFIKNSLRSPLLEKNDERILIKKWLKKGDEKSLHQLTQSHMRLVISYAFKYKSYGLSVSDLIQEGCIGLMKAAERFDLNQDVRFSTYAGWWIRAAMQDFILKNWSLVKLASSSKQKSLFFTLRKLKHKIQNTEHGTVDFKTAQDLASNLQISTSDVINMDIKISQHEGSLNAKISDEGNNEFLDLIEDEDARPDDAVFSKEDKSFKKDLIYDSMKILNKREKIIIKNRYLFENRKTLDLLGKELKISKERVRQIENEAMIKMRIHISNEHKKDLLF
mgnify:CR=1 FL=1|tara:strand:- start:1749 stop:2612 length:864 start_codon:yes stop_codon:yes gene_type:complete